MKRWKEKKHKIKNHRMHFLQMEMACVVVVFFIYAFMCRKWTMNIFWFQFEFAQIPLSWQHWTVGIITNQYLFICICIYKYIHTYRYIFSFYEREQHFHNSKHFWYVMNIFQMIEFSQSACIKCKMEETKKTRTEIQKWNSRGSRWNKICTTRMVRRGKHYRDDDFLSFYLVCFSGIE